MNSLLTSISNKQEMFGIAALVLAGLFIYKPLFRPGPLPGPDTPFYLYMLQQLERTGDVRVFKVAFDRNIAFLFPYAIHWILRLPLESSLRLTGFVLFVSLAASVYRLALVIYRDHLVSLMAVIILLTTKASYRISWDLYANMFGLIFFNLLAAEVIEAVQARRWEWKRGLRIVGLTVLLFNSHNLASTNLVPVVLGYLFSLSLGAYVIKHSRSKHKIKLNLSLMILIALTVLLANPPFTLRLVPKYLYYGLVVPLRQWFSQAQTESELPSFVMTTVAERHKFPQLVWVFRMFYTAKIWLLAGIGSLLSWFYQRKQWESWWLLGCWLVWGLLLSQQRLVGLNWLPDRHILMLVVPISVLAGYGLYRLIQVIKAPVLASLIIFLTLYPGFNQSVSFIRFNYTPTISQKEFDYLRQVNSYLASKESSRPVVITTSIRDWWTKALIPQAEVVAAEYYQICYQNANLTWLDSRQIDVANAFSQRLNLDESVKLLEKHFSGRELYLLLGEKDECVDLKKFIHKSDLMVELVKDGYYLVKLFPKVEGD